MKEIETERYEIRIPKIEDAEEIYEKWGTDKEKMAEYKEHKLYRNVIEAKALITAAIQETENGEIFWIIEDKKTKKIVGYIKLLSGIEKDKKRDVAFYFLNGYRKDGTPEEEKVDQTIPFKWSDWLIKGYTLDQAILAAAGQYLKQVMNNMCIKHGCFKTP